MIKNSKIDFYSVASSRPFTHSQISWTVAARMIVTDYVECQGVTLRYNMQHYKTACITMSNVEWQLVTLNGALYDVALVVVFSAI